MNLFFTRPDRYFHPGCFPIPEVKHIRIGGAPEFMKPLRALFLSDIHLRPGTRDDRLQALVALLRDQAADLLLLGGDYAETDRDCRRFFEAISTLHFPLGGFAVPGNNDLASMPHLEDTMARAGVTLLYNRSEMLSLPGGRLEIGGCDDHKYGNPRTRGLFCSDDRAYRILLSHFPVTPDCSCNLMLSGHTHAGQFNFLGVTPYSIGFEHRYGILGVRGLHRIEGMNLLVGNGIGVSRLPMRIGAAPQIYLLEFGSEDF